MFRTIFDLFKFIFKKVTKLSIPYFSVEENDLKFKISTDSYYKYTLYNIVIKVRHDPYVYEAYTLKANNIFIEYIHTLNDVMWNSQPFSYFLNLLKDELKVDSFENLEKKQHNHYEFNIYRVNNEFNLYLIYIYEMNKEIFIIDKKGLLFEKLIQNFDKTILVEYQNKDILDLNLNFSLVKNNGLRNYFKLASS